MIDISGPKISIPAGLFAILAPGMILNLPDSYKLCSMRTSLHNVLFHAMVFILLFKISAHVAGVTLSQADLVVPTILFILLNPGILLTLPPGTGGVWMSGQTNLTAILTHTMVFAITFALLRKTFPMYY